MRTPDEKIVKDVHTLLMENILTGGVYRREEVVISGASHTPPAGNDMYAQIINFQNKVSDKIVWCFFSSPKSKTGLL